ncbi:ParB/RepB/Spo0J family partition protein [Streptomyces sp. NPDC102441]|uniref:ParB/RepB/Spo0J family partition protein n=1 Tax=Streptomyces sp. NPDC102441 TaxID=3366176 RepID=UPI0037FC8355
MGHARLLAEVETELPPIVVHRSTMRVIDGMHRVQAAEMRGRTTIRAQLFDGDEQDAFLLAIAVNVRHGLPLTAADRAAAVERILSSHSEWSDRALASFAGVSARRVAEIRRKLKTDVPALEARIGRDGRLRPVDSTHRREHAHQLLLVDPSASLRTIAREVGISPATVADVRDRIQRGLGPVPAGVRGKAKRTARVPSGRCHSPQGPPPPSLAEVLALSDRLRRDPTVRLSETGRTMLRMLDSCATVAREKQKIIDFLPAHCVDSAENIMHALADLCHSFGDDLSQRRHSMTEEFAIGGAVAD